MMSKLSNARHHMHDMRNINIATYSIHLWWDIGLVNVSESSSEGLPVTIKIYASTGTIASSEDLVFTPDFFHNWLK